MQLPLRLSSTLVSPHRAARSKPQPEHPREHVVAAAMTMPRSPALNSRVRVLETSDEDGDIRAGLTRHDAAALELAFDRYGGLAFGLAMRSLGDRGRAEEVVQDVFLKAWDNFESFDESRGSFRTWLLTMVRNRSIDSLRGRWRRQRDESELPVDLRDSGRVSDPSGLVETRMERAVIREAVASLPPDQRTAIELAFFEGHTHTELAERLDIPLGTVKGRLRLGMEKLHTYMLARGVAMR
jgi:RNA polymerase sigma-70 factor (ECF subfamily)